MYLCRLEDVPQVEFMYLVLPGESYRRRLRSLLLYLCDISWALINSLVFWCHSFQLQQYLEWIRAVIIVNHICFFLSFFPPLCISRTGQQIPTDSVQWYYHHQYWTMNSVQWHCDDEQCPVTVPWWTESNDIVMINTERWTMSSDIATPFIDKLFSDIIPWMMNSDQWNSYDHYCISDDQCPAIFNLHYRMLNNVYQSFWAMISLPWHPHQHYPKLNSC